MRRVTEQEVKSFLFGHLSGRLAGRAFDAFTNELDLLKEGVVDSLGVIEMISAVEKHFDTSIDFEGLPAEEFTILGPLCRYIADSCNVKCTDRSGGIGRNSLTDPVS